MILPLASLLLVILGCTPTCSDVCEEIVACENAGTERMSAEECTEACTAQHTLLNDTWTDTQKRDAFDDELTCLYNAECSEIEAGACYDADVWSYSPD